MNNSNLSLPIVINNVTGSENIVKIWKTHYEKLFNCLKNTNHIHTLYNDNTIHFVTDMLISHTEITTAIEGLGNGKSCGLDNIYAEHLTHCSNRVLPLLSMYFTSMFVHGFLPE